MIFYVYRLLNWSNNFGGQLFQFGVSVTKYNELQNVSFLIVI